MRVVIRTDSGMHIGSGHLMRCLTLANELRIRGAEVVFVSREHHGHLINLLDDVDYRVIRLFPVVQQDKSLDNDDYNDWLGSTSTEDADQTLSFLLDYNPDWLIVDHYGLDINWEVKMRLVVKHILVIDDLANRSHDCDILLDQNYFATNTMHRYRYKVPEACKCLLGPRYALVQQEYSELHKLLHDHTGRVSRVFIYFGNTDLTDRTSQVLIALSSPNLEHLVVDIVVGTNYPNVSELEILAAKRLKTNVYRHTSSLVEFFMQADLAIGAGGATTWERMCLGLPSLVISIAENQRELTEILAKNRYQILLSSDGDITPKSWENALVNIIRQPNIIKQLAERSKGLVDGLGVKRVARVMYGHSKCELTVRRACLDDQAILLEWANDLDVRINSFSQKAISWSEHSEWMIKKIADQNCFLLIIEDNFGLPLGQVRFDLNHQRTEALISISLDIALRGMRFSILLLEQSIQYLKQKDVILVLIAEVRLSNFSSQRLFKNCGFVPIQPRRPDSVTFKFCM